MQIAQTYIVNDDTRIIPVYVTFDNRFFIPYHVVGQLTEITSEKAKQLLDHEPPKTGK